MRVRWLFPGVLSLFLLANPAKAGQLQFWRFDSSQNRLEFTTDEGVQPKAQLIADPARLVIDLPGTVFGRPAVTQPVGGAIRSIRVGQFDRQTTRLVIEMASGYTIDPQQVRFRGVTASQWSVQLPTPQLVAQASSPDASNRASENVPPPRALPGNRGESQQTEPLATIQAINVEGNGSRLLIQADQFVTATSGWDRASGDYRILLSPARLAARIQEPRLSASSPLVRIRLRQEDTRTVAVFLKPAAGVQIGAANPLPSRTVALQLQQPQTARIAPISPSLQPIPVSPPLTSTPPVNVPRRPDGRLVVVLDPGHGGPDPGAVGIGGLQEKGVVLEISQQVAALLEQQGIQAILTRPDDRDLGLAPRVQIAKQMNATLFVSIHANAISMSRPEVNGLETYYFSSGENLARTVHERVLQETGIGDRRVRKARFYVLRYTTMPSILVEVGFLTGQNDAPKLADPAYRSQTAAAIARGIMQYLQVGNPAAIAP